MRNPVLRLGNANTWVRFCVLFCMIAGVVTATSAAESTEAEMTGDPTMTQPQNYFVKLLGTREGRPEDMNEIESEVMNDHYQYLKNLVNTGKVVLAGPSFDPVFGMVVLRVDSETEAREIMDNEPSVLAGVHTYEMHPMHVSLVAHEDASTRYVKRPIDRVISKDVVVNCSLDKAWHAWTSAEGVTSFFVPEASVQLRPGGRYELIIVPTSPEGQRGSEDCRILSFLPKSMLSFEWSAPPQFGDLRNKRTIVVLTFDEFGPGQIRVTLSQHGWGAGDEWERLYDYFDRAWTSVLSAFKKYAESTE